MIDQCVTNCGNLKCRYNEKCQKGVKDVRMVFMRDRPKMGCLGYMTNRATGSEKTVRKTAARKPTAKKTEKKPAKKPARAAGIRKGEKK